MCIMIIRLVSTELIIERQPVRRRLRVVQCEISKQYQSCAIITRYYVSFTARHGSIVFYNLV